MNTTRSERLKNRTFNIKCNKITGAINFHCKGLYFCEDESQILISLEGKAKEDTKDKVGNDIELILRSKGVVVNITDRSICIFNDPFCTLPVYFSEDTETVILSSHPEEVIDYKNAQLDSAGFWETVLLGGGVWTRTAFSGLYQLPSASFLEIKFGFGISVKRYWDFSSHQNHYNSNTDSDWIDELDKHIEKLFSSNLSGINIFGLSGGLDSRITAKYLTKVDAITDLRAFTFAFNKISYEYAYSKQVASLLGINEPEFFQMADEHYVEALNIFPYLTAGQISCNHTHMYAYLANLPKVLRDCCTHVSSYYTDALFGFECSGRLEKKILEERSVYKKISMFPCIGPDVKDLILDDIKKSFTGLGDMDNFSTLDEVRYVVERNPRFHMGLAFVYSQLMPVKTIFADYDLLCFVLSIPLHLRCRKRIAIEILADSGLERIPSCSSISRFSKAKSIGMPKLNFYEYMTYIGFRALNLANQLAGYSTKGRLVFPNRYHTEELQGVYLRNFEARLFKSHNNSDIAKFNGVCPSIFTNHRPLIERHLSEKFQVLGLAHLIEGVN